MARKEKLRELNIVVEDPNMQEEDEVEMVETLSAVASTPAKSEGGDALLNSNLNQSVDVQVIQEQLSELSQLIVTLDERLSRAEDNIQRMSSGEGAVSTATVAKTTTRMIADLANSIIGKSWAGAFKEERALIQDTMTALQTQGVFKDFEVLSERKFVSGVAPPGKAIVLTGAQGRVTKVLLPQD